MLSEALRHIGLWLLRGALDWAALTNAVRPNELARSALVVSPHFDDETLGCGGNIVRHRRHTAKVKLVFMTDGSRSHAGLIPESELREIRAREALEAGEALGVPEDDICLLGFPETRLKEHEAHAVEAVTDLLFRFQPEQVFMPYVREPKLWSEDHQVTTRVVQAALARYNQPVTVYEYPIWFWYAWPWVSRTDGRERGRWAMLRTGLQSGAQLLQDGLVAVDIRDALDQKRAALRRHRSQMERLVPGPRWATLGDVADGQFLALFFRPYEYYRRWQWRPAPTGPAPAAKASEQVKAG